MAELRDFLSELATDPQRLGQFILDHEAAMTEAERATHADHSSRIHWLLLCWRTRKILERSDDGPDIVLERRSARSQPSEPH